MIPHMFVKEILLETMLQKLKKKLYLANTILPDLVNIMKNQYKE